MKEGLKKVFPAKKKYQKLFRKKKQKAPGAVESWGAGGTGPRAVIVAFAFAAWAEIIAPKTVRACEAEDGRDQEQKEADDGNH